MAEAIDRRPSRRAPLPVSYLLVWGLLASLALGYLALLALRPDLAARMLIGPSEGSPEGNRGQRARALAELGDLKASLGQLETAVADLKSALAAEVQRAQALEARMSALEASQRAPGTPIASTAGFQTEVTEAGRSANALDGAAVQGAVEERTGKRPAPPPKTIASATGAPAAKAADAPQSAPLGLWVASGPSLDAVRLSWQLLQDSNKSALKSLEPRYIESSGDPPAFQLIAGPVGTREEAARICDRIKAKQTRCSVIPFAGQPL